MRRVIVFLFALLCVSDKSYSQGPEAPSASPTGVNGRRAPYQELSRELDSFEEQTVADTDLPASLTLEQLKEGVEHRLGQIESMHVRFKSHNQVFLSAPGESGRTESTGTEPSEFQYEIDFHMKGPKRYFANIGKKNVTVFDGEVTKQLFGESRSAAVELGRTEDFEDDAMDYFVPISLPVAKRDRFVQSFYYVPTALSFATEYRVLEKLSRVDGFPCHVVTSGYDTLWIDHENGFALRRRIIFDRKGKGDAGSLTVMITSRDFRELSSGHLLPQLCRWTHFAGRSFPPSQLGKIKSIMTVSVSELTVNQTSDDQFNYEFPPGTLVGDVRLGKSYWMPKGIEMLDEAVKAGADIVDNQSSMPQLPSTPLVNNREPAKTNLLVIANIAAFLSLIGLLAYRQWKIKRSLPSGTNGGQE